MRGRLTVEERDELREPSGNVGGREVVDGEVLGRCRGRRGIAALVSLLLVGVL